MTTVQQVLDRKGSEVWYISPDATVFDAIAHHNCNSVALPDAKSTVS